MIEHEQVRKNLSILFKNASDSAIWSYFDNEHGFGEADDIKNTKCGRIICGDFCYLAGDIKAAGAERLIKEFPEKIKNRSLIFMPQSDDWCSFIEEKTNYKKGSRYAIKKEGNIFNQKQLWAAVLQLSEDYELVRIGQAEYDLIMKEKWSKDFCSNFAGKEDFLNRGIGFVIKKAGQIVSGASSYTVYHGGIEIEIATKKEFRQKGLAKVCAAKLILECLKKGWYPSWDAANKISVRLAESLGYHFDKEYIVYFK